jgi:hypothetical protein
VLGGTTSLANQNVSIAGQIVKAPSNNIFALRSNDGDNRQLKYSNLIKPSYTSLSRPNMILEKTQQEPVLVIAESNNMISFNNIIAKQAEEVKFVSSAKKSQIFDKYKEEDRVLNNKNFDFLLKFFR